MIQVYGLIQQNLHKYDTNMMKYYFYENIVLGFEGETLPQGFPLVSSFSERMNGCFPLTQEQTDYYLANSNESILNVYYCGNAPQAEPILPTLEERQNELRAKFAVKQIEIKQALITAEETVGSDNPTLLYLKTQLLNERVRIITTIDNFTTIDEALAFDIRDEDAQPFMDALYNLINSI